MDIKIYTNKKRQELVSQFEVILGELAELERVTLIKQQELLRMQGKYSLLGEMEKVNPEEGHKEEKLEKKL